MTQVHDSVARSFRCLVCRLLFVMFDNRTAETIRNRTIAGLGRPTSHLSDRPAGRLQSTRREMRFVNRLDVVAGNCYGQRSLNQFDGNHQTLIALHGIENSFNAVQCASADADSLADVQKRMLPDRNLLSQNRLNGRNFALRYWRAGAAYADKAHHTVGTKHCDPGPGFWGDANEDIPRKKRGFDQALAIAPLPHFGNCRQETLDLFRLQLA